MAYARLSDGSLDYQPCRYGSSKLVFRGPVVDINRDYVAFLGGSETYGKFIERPFPDIVGARLGLPALNLGCVSAGVDVYHEDPTVLELARLAKLRVVQVAGAQNLSNRMYTVHPRRNDRFVKASRLLTVLYPEIDFTEIHFTGHLITALRATSTERFELVVEELTSAWQARMAKFLKRIGGPTVLLFLSPRGADETAMLLQAEPRLIDAELLKSMESYATAIVHASTPPSGEKAGASGMIFSELEAAAAASLPAPDVHMQIAEAIISALKKS